jgi:hypothetical protein
MPLSPRQRLIMDNCSDLAQARRDSDRGATGSDGVISCSRTGCLGCLIPIPGADSNLTSSFVLYDVGAEPEARTTQEISCLSGTKERQL